MQSLKGVKLGKSNETDERPIAWSCEGYAAPFTGTCALGQAYGIIGGAVDFGGPNNRVPAVLSGSKWRARES